MLEYIALIGLVVIALLAMSTGMRRGIQGVLRIVCTHIGIQQDAEQAFDETGHLISSRTAAQSVGDTVTDERLGVYNYIYNDRADSQTSTLSNVGFTERN